MVHGVITNKWVRNRTIAASIAGKILKPSLIILSDIIISVVIVIRSLTYNGILDVARISCNIDNKVRCCDAEPREGRRCRIAQMQYFAIKISGEALNNSSICGN